MTYIFLNDPVVNKGMIDSKFISQIKTICTDAGAAIMPFFPAHVDSGVKRKQDGSPVTLADPASEDIIIAGLQSLTPDIPIIAEEQFEDENAPDITTADYYWLVDPLDGTKEFIKGSPDFCINIGLIQNGTPAFGAVYCPATQDFYYGGSAVNGAFLNNAPLTTLDFNHTHGLTIVGTKNFVTNHKLISYLGDTKIAGHVIRGSTLKFLLIAEGRANFYGRFVPTYEWDTAAAHAMLLAVGADIIDYSTQRRLAYGKDNFHNGPLITATKPVLAHFKLTP
jgi:3'(2'), 5'-bisphosphate nucleotidase